jgi:hypothetical protein
MWRDSLRFEHHPMPGAWVPSTIWSTVPRAASTVRRTHPLRSQRIRYRLPPTCGLLE